MKYFISTLIFTLSLSFSTQSHSFEKESLTSSEIQSAIAEFTLEQDREGKIQPQLICRTVYSAGYTRATASSGVKVIASFTVYPECAREYQTFQITDNVAGANFRVYLLRSDNSEYRSGTFGVTGYPPAGTYYWAVENEGGGDGSGSFEYEYGYTR